MTATSGAGAGTPGWCSICGSDTAREQVPCAEGHGADCPEWLCVDCGYLVLVGTLADDATGSRTAGAA